MCGRVVDVLCIRPCEFDDSCSLTTRERVIRELCTTELSFCKNLQQVVKAAIPIADFLKVSKQPFSGSS